jgi:hypothetical protein
MELSEVLDRTRDALRAGSFPSEAAVSQGVVLPVLRALGWPDHDTEIVWPQYTVEGTRVDYALCHPRGRPAVFLEVKQVGQSEGGDRQLFEYAFHTGVPLAVLTDGRDWSFYLPAGRGSYQERQVYRLDLLERTLDESADRLKRYLGYESVCSEEFRRHAEADYDSVARARQIQAALPEAWRRLVAEQDSLLIELIADAVADVTGYKPEPDVVAEFLEGGLQLLTAARAMPESGALPSGVTETRVSRPTPRAGPMPFRLCGREFQGRSAIEVLIAVLEHLSSTDQGFLDHFPARKHGRLRRYVARNREELYPGRPDLSQHSQRLSSGWWVGKNYSKREIKRMLEMACEVAGLRFGVDLIVNLD